VDEVDRHVVEHDPEVVPLVERGLEPAKSKPSRQYASVSCIQSWLAPYFHSSLP
jgi:hypothetical protein